MAIAIKMPDVGTTVDHVKLVRWIKAEGASVKRGEPLCEVETDKATVELESVAEGILLKHLVGEGGDIEQGTVIAYIGAAGEAIPAAGATTAPAGKAKTATEPARQTGGAKPSVLVQNLAKREGVDLAKVTGTGPGGMITREDVLSAKAGRTSKPAPAAGVALSNNQRVVAARVSQSHREIVPIHMVARVEMARVEALRELKGKEGHKVSVDAIFVHAISRIIERFPHFRRHILGDMTMSEATPGDIGVAVSFGDDLFTATVKGPGGKTIEAIDADIRGMATKAKAGNLTVEEMSGACMTISNLGMYPVTTFNAVIPPGQSAALAVGAIEEQAAVREGAVTTKRVASITLTVDHRLINGREAAEFLSALKQIVETI